MTLYFRIMLPPAERELYRSIRQRQFSSVYYFFGENDYLKEIAVRDLAQSAVDPATRDFNLDQVDAAETNAELLEVLLNTPPMMASIRVAVLRNVQALRKDSRQVLDRYLAHPSRDLLLVLVGDAEARKDVVLSECATHVEFAPLSPERLRRWVQHHAGSSLGVQINESATELLLSTVGPDLPQLAAELEKLSNFTSGGPIREETVSGVVGVRHGETLADLLDAVAMRAGNRALDLVPFVLQQPKVGAVQVLMALATQTLALGWGNAARARGLPQHLLEREFFLLLKESRTLPGRPWGDAVKTWTRAIPIWDDTSLADALDALLEADRAAKETRYSSEEQLVRNAVLAMCAPRRSRIA